MGFSKKQMSALYTSVGLLIIISILILISNDEQEERPIFDASVFNEKYSEITHFDLNLTVFMHNQTLIGSVTHNITLKVRILESLHFDIREMKILGVRMFL